MFGSRSLKERSARMQLLTISDSGVPLDGLFELPMTMFMTLGMCLEVDGKSANVTESSHAQCKL